MRFRDNEERRPGGRLSRSADETCVCYQLFVGQPFPPCASHVRVVAPSSLRVILNVAPLTDWVSTSYSLLLAATVTAFRQALPSAAAVDPPHSMIVGSYLWSCLTSMPVYRPSWSVAYVSAVV